VLTSPTYHGSYSSHLKNALDCLSGNGFSGKTVVIATHGWSATAMGPAMHLQDVVRTLEGNLYRRFIVMNTVELSSQLSDSSQARIAEIVGEAASF
jgi:NAD(P)H-dependent FMN reductase